MEFSSRYATSDQMESVCQVKETTMDKVITLSEEEAETIKKVYNFLTDEEIDRFFPKFRDILNKVNNG
jgi:hypothetical protein